MSKKYSYGAFDRTAWAVMSAGIGVLLLVLGLGYYSFVPQERPAVAVSWLNALGAGQPVFLQPLTRVVFVVIGVFALINAILIYRAGSATIEIDDNAISYNRGRKTVRVPWSEVVDVKKRVTVGVRVGATEVVSIISEKDPYKITFNSKIQGYEALLEAIQNHTKARV